MPIRKKAKKSLRQSLKRQKRNKSLFASLKKHVKKFNTLLSQQKLDEAKNFLQKTLLAKIDKAAKHRVIHKNTASRKKSRLTKKLTRQKSQPSKTA